MEPMRLTRLGIAILFIGSVMSLPGAEAQNPTTCDHPAIGCCGDITLLLLNPDLQPRSDGFIHASGNFFIQFQAIGEGADQIATFGFSFGAQTTQIPDDVCDLPPEAWFTGQQVLNYRADTSPDDGFFINLQTGLVPDGQYTAALHAYDANDNELARFWTSAVVANCDTPEIPGTPIERCGDTPEELLRNDFIMPWPIVLPGDGLTTADVNGFSIEFAEELAEGSLLVTLNGEDITDQLEPWEGRLWDNDLKPGYGPNGLLGANPLTQECSSSVPTIPQVHACDHLGVAFQWTQRPLTDDDVVRVEAADLAGNRVTKDLHIGSGVTSGAVSALIPIMDWSADRTVAEVEPGQNALFRFTITNRGGETGHPFADQSLPAGWDFEWMPPHVPVDSGKSEPQEFLVKVPSDAAPGSYPVTALMNYSQQGSIKTLRQDLTVTVMEIAGGPGTGAVPEAAGAEGEADTPAPPIVMVLVAVAAAVAAVRRRDGG